ncbi:hypothetical protein [Bradyrhizobium vignae]|uniref:hypothetical protein n=1 Tax=Bradyrhizobium vignae TaxID=1549949 RepID=UPI0035DD4723
MKLLPNDPYAYNGRGIIYLERRQFDQALADFAQLFILSGFAPAFYNRGKVYGELNRPDKALADHSQAIRLNPRYAKRLQ